MNTENIRLMRTAREALKGKWGVAILTFFIYEALTAGPNLVNMDRTVSILSLVNLFIGGPLALGTAIFSLNISRGKQADIGQLFEGFKYFANAMITYLLMILYVFLWFLCLIIPGIIAALGYSMTFFILADDPTLRPAEALRKSKAMMMGHKEKMFYLQLRFALLAFLCILTFGIGFLWLIPYIHVTMAKFYEDIHAEELFETIGS